MKSIPKYKKDSKNKSISKPKNNLQTIEIETSSKFKNELFQKLFDNYNASKERVNTYGNNRQPKYIRPSPKSTKITQKIVFKNRNPSYIENLKKSRKRLQSSNPKLENNTYTNINPNSTYVIKSKKPSKSNNAKKKLRDYPNLIKGVLRQVNYYNLNNNINYNDNIRYKPIDDFYNEQSSIFIKNIIENNTNSPNTSINLDEQKSEFQSNNNNIFNPKNSHDNYSNNIPKIKNNEEDEYLEQEIKSNKVKYRRSRGENNIKSIKNISPISPIKIRNIYRNDIPYLNEDIYNDNSDNNLKNNYNRKPSFINNNETIVTDDDDNFRNKKKDKLVITSNNFCLNNKNTPNIDMESANKRKIELSIENVNDFTLFNIKQNPIINYNLEEKPADSFNIIQNRKNYDTNQNNFNNLEEANLPMINFLGVYNKNSDNDSKESISGNNGGKLSFNNDDEVIRYIKEKIREEKDLQYNNNKMKYNYFNLIKMFHGKKLYEIGLENNLNKINNILEKEKVEVEHEPIMFIFKKDLNKIKNGEAVINSSNTNNQNSHDEIEKLMKEKEQIINENEKLKKKIESMNNNNKNFGEKNNDYDKLLNEIEKLNQQNKEKQNMLNEYEKKMNQYNQIVEINNILQVEKEKYTKYIIELQEYNEKIIIEYNKMKAQLERELSNKKNNNNFNSNELDIISADFFELININRSKSINNINNITFEDIQNEELNEPNNFGDEGYDKNKITIRQSFDSNQKETIHTIKDNNDINADLQNMDDNSNKKSIKDYLNMNKYNEDKNINNEEEIIVDDDININNINNKFNDGKINNDEEIIEDNLNINANIEKANIEDEKNNEIYDNYTNNKKKHVNFSDKDSNSIKDESRELSPKKKDESMFRALQRIKNKRKIDEKNNKEKNATRKSERISGLAKMLEKKLNENPSHNPLNNDIRNNENNVDDDEDPDDNEMY